MKFEKVKNTFYDLTYDWMLVIEDEQSLEDYFQKSMSGKLRGVWDNMIEVAEGRAHYNTRLGGLIAMHADGKKSMVELTANVLDKIYEAKRKALRNYGKIYINKVGGFFFHADFIQVLESIEIPGENIIFPAYTKADIKVQQWPNGTHYYAYVGDFEVVDMRYKHEGQKKWDTRKEAEEAASYYLYKMREVQFQIKGDSELPD